MKTMTLLLGLVLPLAALASTDRVYRWTDKDGVVHYSQTEPARIKAEARDVRTTRPTPTKPVEVKPKTVRQSNCEQARLNVDLLASKQPLTTDKDGDGKSEPMAEADRKQSKELNLRQVAQYCDGG